MTLHMSSDRYIVSHMHLTAVNSCVTSFYYLLLWFCIRFSNVYLIEVDIHKCIHLYTPPLILTDVTSFVNR